MNLEIRSATSIVRDSLRGSRFEAAATRRFPSASSGRKGLLVFSPDLSGLCNIGPCGGDRFKCEKLR